ncbi:MAG: hypothetical protein LBP22_11195 [Deltaproteobacteria bacterium]|jgi:hypothetical protein|nr:hypothetical protein [Deltaproteobacteria bacterium]
MTMEGKFKYSRMALVPSSKADTDKLRELGMTGKMVFPLDEALGIADLPYKMTVSVMLEIARWVKETNSFEAAGRAVTRNTSIAVNDETVRAVANTIGALVFKNDTLEADNVFADFESGNLKFPAAIKKDTLYFEIDGAMMHTREREEKKDVCGKKIN